jgi:hypothetical protein
MQKWNWIYARKRTVLQELANQIEQMVRDANQPGIKVKFEYEMIGERPYGEIAKDHPLETLPKPCWKGRDIHPNRDRIYRRQRTAQ